MAEDPDHLAKVALATATGTPSQHAHKYFAHMPITTQDKYRRIAAAVERAVMEREEARGVRINKATPPPFDFEDER